MKEVKVKFTLGIGFAGATHEEKIEFEFEDAANQDEIEKELEEAWQDWAWNYIDGGWEIQ